MPTTDETRVLNYFRTQPLTVAYAMLEHCKTQVELRKVREVEEMKKPRRTTGVEHSTGDALRLPLPPAGSPIVFGKLPARKITWHKAAVKTKKRR